MDWTHRLRLRNLEMLLSLAETGNMSLSATMLNTTQPGLSKWLKDLEDEIGLPLFERQARGLRPTSCGEALIGHARRLQAQLDAARDDLQVIREGGSGLVVVGTSGAAAADTVPMALMELLRQRPATQARVIETTMDSLMAQLSRSELDIVVGRSAPELQKDSVVRSESLFMESIHFVARSGHPLFAIDQPSWSDMLRYRWVVWPKGTPIRNALESALEAEGISIPVESVHTNSAVVSLTLLSQSDMVGLFSHRTANRLEALGSLRMIPFRLPGFGSVSMYWRADTEDRIAVTAMLECLRRAAGARIEDGEHEL
ncbi:LysR family transcriptional regulator [Burkholderia diffusa]|uniref:LysR family transcriptional regulator n=1 Tax=Burkholderia diffusa TaxID=488732 RepID=A0AAW3PC55_9BURK|nr:LysR substrate-binding domain-containing protein [Burkholderia diffusa]KWF32771.1 LysR family transcriptional regulator [Burkholderia diffusa]KWF38694.1 LysR family transcriptional regulator [Burkholderia diffusa]KWF46739.1 LysR family transcriptional regulator [Burkholderia diffusa]KWF50690.1 LysR family transcriptional regulator [Burkholderia diffusa]